MYECHDGRIFILSSFFSQVNNNVFFFVTPCRDVFTHVSQLFSPIRYITLFFFLFTTLSLTYFCQPLCIFFPSVDFLSCASLSLSLSLFILYVVIFFSFRSDSRSILFPDFPLSLEYVQTIYLISASTFRARPISLISLISFKSDSRRKVLGDCGVRLTSY